MNIHRLFSSAGIAAALWVAVWLASAGQALAQDRMVIATDVACRDQPVTTAPVVTLLQAGDGLSIIADRSSDGAAWYHVSDRTPGVRMFGHWGVRSPCWVHGGLTVAFSPQDPGAALAAVAERVLARDAATFDELVAAGNLFGWEPLDAVTDASGYLQLLRLRLVDRAARRVSPIPPANEAWLQAHRDLLDVSPFSSSWYVRAEHYWALHARHEGTPAADDIAWAAAQAFFPSDECYTTCMLGLLERTYEQYWTRYPRGRFITEAITAAATRAEYASQFCILAATSEYASLGDGEAQARARRLRESLDPVAAPERDALIATLSEIERTCSRDAVSLDDPRGHSRPDSCD